MFDLETVKNNLEKRGYSVKLCATADEAAKCVLELIAPDASVGIGGSVTVSQLGIYDTLMKRGNKVHWHWQPGSDGVAYERAEGLVSDVFLCSANALTVSGQIINIDGTGNRLAATLFGPGRLIMIIGRNKLADDYDSAIKRIKDVACPKNAKRLGINTPCAVLGYCTDCNSPQRMCNATLIFDRAPKGHPIDIVLVDEDLGY